MQRRAFTLIELLVVIAIIAILAAILFPVFAQARDKARSAACLSNTKQLALGVYQYAQDYDETLPVAGYNAQCRGRWQWQIYPYVKNEQVFTCPNISQQPWRATTGVNFNYTCPNSGQVITSGLGQNDKGGYGWNYALHGDSGDVTGAALDRAPGYSLAAINKPADTVIIGETGFIGTAGTASGWAMMAWDPRNTGSAGFSQPGLFAQGRHNSEQTVTMQGMPVPVKGRLNVVFLDGHAKNLSLGQLFEKAPNVGGVAVEDGVTLTNEDGVATYAQGTCVNCVRSHNYYRLLNRD
ncbi:prepilin-type N-terminal cleavage/methylation domain-containing protein [Armatimonas rosea]|uniref:Prepilin-type N-terminal cleavage/methylation domain-containing protein/prepilin-type processing-associated H-X9-DG protein n=1 Tax=Armatimonas rosea TaxID=685828 RepID=A0A7W9SVQ1_ARMRO|nr:prepilin-type N-terminal cleavage/methylation domain-containing protein [Armatimonas rosea]MBB6053230.1 prepilin-type N-terminal cleavage/methylation domain-containing protein/prepilin-type processing-associated H-X9-DG protein [Armatimonas rosea]